MSDGSVHAQEADSTVVRSAVRNGALGAAGAVTASGLGFVLAFCVARFVGAEGAGFFYSATALATILIGLGTSGADTGLVWSLARERGAPTGRGLRPLLHIALVPVGAVGLLSGLAVWIAAPYIAPLIDADQSADVTQLLRAVSLAVALGPLTLCLVNGSRGVGNVKPFVFIQQLGLPLVRVLAVVALGLIGLTSPMALGLGWSLPLVVALALALYAVWSRVGREERVLGLTARVRVDRARVREFWRYSLPRGFGNACSIALTWSDIVVVAMLASPTEAGIYAVASRFATGGQLALQAVRLAIGPQVSMAFARDDLDSATLLYRASSRWAVLGSWPLFICIAAFAEVFLGFFGAEFVEGAVPLLILCAAMMFSVTAGSVGTVLLMSGHSLWAARNSFLALTVNLALNLLLVPQYGAVGAAISWACAIVLENSLGLWLVHFRLGIPRGNPLFWKTATAVTVLAVVPAVTIRLALGATGLAVVLQVLLVVALISLFAYRYRRALGFHLLFTRRR